MRLKDDTGGREAGNIRWEFSVINPSPSPKAECMHCNKTFLSGVASKMDIKVTLRKERFTTIFAMKSRWFFKHVSVYNAYAFLRLCDLLKEWGQSSVCADKKTLQNYMLSQSFPKCELVYWAWASSWASPPCRAPPRWARAPPPPPSYC